MLKVLYLFIIFCRETFQKTTAAVVYLTEIYLDFSYKEIKRYEFFKKLVYLFVFVSFKPFVVHDWHNTSANTVFCYLNLSSAGIILFLFYFRCFSLGMAGWILFFSYTYCATFTFGILSRPLQSLTYIFKMIVLLTQTTSTAVSSFYLLVQLLYTTSCRYRIVYSVFNIQINAHISYKPAVKRWFRNYILISADKQPEIWHNGVRMQCTFVLNFSTFHFIYSAIFSLYVIVANCNHFIRVLDDNRMLKPLLSPFISSDTNRNNQ